MNWYVQASVPLRDVRAVAAGHGPGGAGQDGAGGHQALHEQPLVLAGRRLLRAQGGGRRALRRALRRDLPRAAPARLQR